MVPFIRFPALLFHSLHGKVWMSSVFSFPFVPVSPWLFAVARARRWTGSFLIRQGCFHARMPICRPIYRVRKSADTRIWTTEDRIGPYTVCAKKAVNVVYSSSNSRVVRLTLLCLYVCCCCLSCYLLAVRVSYHGAGFSSFGGSCS